MQKGQSSYNTRLKKIMVSLFTDGIKTSYSASDVYDMILSKGEKVNLTTVYRNLDSMSADGFLIKTASGDGERAYYQYAGVDGRCHSHLHIRCLSCGQVCHLDCSFMNDLKDHLYNDHRIELCCEKSVLYGICKTCSERENNRE